MNLYASTSKGIIAAKAAQRRRLLEQMAAAALRKVKRPGQSPQQVPVLDSAITGETNAGSRSLVSAIANLFRP